MNKIDPYVSTHAPRVGSDVIALARLAGVLFQLTLPEWGATRIRYTLTARRAVSTHAPRVGSDEKVNTLQQSLYVSTHAPRVGSDLLRKDTFIYRYFKGHFANRNSGKLFAPINRGL